MSASPPATLTEALATWRGAVLGAAVVIIAAVIGAGAAIGGSVLTAQFEENRDIRAERQVLYATFINESTKFGEELRQIDFTGAQDLFDANGDPEWPLVSASDLERLQKMFNDFSLLSDRVQLIAGEEMRDRAIRVETALEAGVQHLERVYCASEGRVEKLCPDAYAIIELEEYWKLSDYGYSFFFGAREELEID